MEEQFGSINVDDRNHKKKPHGGGATIGFQYDDSTPKPFVQTINEIDTNPSTSRYDDYAKDSSDSDLDLNLDMQKIGNEQAHGLNLLAAHKYGMQGNDFYSFLTKDIDDAENLKLQQEEEQEKILYCGRKGRRERRAQRERRFNTKLMDLDTKPSYALDDKKIENKQESVSRSPSPKDGNEKITYITSFGEEEEKKKPESYAAKVKQNLGALKKLNEASKRRPVSRKRYSSSDSSPERYRRRNESYSRKSRGTSRSRRRSSSSSSSSTSASSPEKASRKK